MPWVVLTASGALRHGVGPALSTVDELKLRKPPGVLVVALVFTMRGLATAHAELAHRYVVLGPGRPRRHLELTAVWAIFAAQETATRLKAARAMLASVTAAVPAPVLSSRCQRV